MENADFRIQFDTRCVPDGFSNQADKGQDIGCRGIGIGGDDIGVARGDKSTSNTKSLETGIFNEFSGKMAGWVCKDGTACTKPAEIESFFLCQRDCGADGIRGGFAKTDLTGDGDSGCKSGCMAISRG